MLMSCGMLCFNYLISTTHKDELCKITRSKWGIDRHTSLDSYKNISQVMTLFVFCGKFARH